jgi:signal peptidase I
MRKFFAAIWDTIEVAVIALVVVLIIRTFLFQPFIVEGSSMYPNFKNGDYLIIDELTYRMREPARGEVIVFHPPRAQSDYYIKRIIGLPNERIVIKDGEIRIYNNSHPDGLLLNESYLLDAKTPGDVDIKLGNNEYFVLGDNRYASYDSRAWGVLYRDKIVGIVRLRVWPFNSVKAFSTVQYQY